MPGARLIVNSRFFHIARAGEKADGKHSMTREAAMGLVEYVGTREGVELNMPDQLSLYEKGGTPLNLDPLRLSPEVAARPATQKQISMIKDLLKAIPESKNTLEYQDYIEHGTIGNATELISHASELGLGYAVDYGKAANLVEYVGKRPGAVRVGEHGLFSSSPNVDLKKAQEEIANCKGNIWTHVISLRREDADMLGYNQQKPWRDLVMQKIDAIANASDIPVSQLHWYAGMHNTTHHPHIHLFVFSDDPKAGRLTVDGINKMKSAFSEVIFADERHQIYIHKDEMRDEIKQSVDRVLEDLSSGSAGHFEKADLDKICSELTCLAGDLKSKQGKKQYGWLLRDPDIRKQVDGIMSDLAKAPEIQKLYDLYCADHIALERMYREDPKDITPIVKNQEFRSIKNRIIREAMKLANTKPGAAEKEKFVSLSDILEENPGDANTSGAASNNPDFSGYDNQDQSEDEENFASLTDNIPPEQEPSAPDDDPETFFPDGEKAAPKEENNDARRPKEKATFKEVYVNAVENREPKGMYQLAERYFRGDGVDRDYVAAQMWYGLAAEAGSNMAKYKIGRMYLYGIGIDRDEKLGKEYCLEAYYGFTGELKEATGINLDRDRFTWEDLPKANAYCAYLEYLVGRMRLAGEGVDTDCLSAFNWFRAAATHGHVHSEYMLAKMIYEGQGVPQSYQDAADFFREAADKEDKYACYAVGRMYYRGIGVTQDLPKAAGYFTKAAEENVPYADYTLAQMAEAGQGIEKNAENASLLYKKALNEFTEQEKQQPDPLTEFRIAKMHLTGKGTAADPQEALKWFLKSAGGGNPFAAYQAARILGKGNCAGRDETQAAKLYADALAGFIKLDKDRPDVQLEYRIGSMFLKGQCFTADPQEALKWFLKSAGGGNAFAAYQAAQILGEGKCAGRDEAQAAKLYADALAGFIKLDKDRPDTQLEYRIGSMYLSGKGTAVNPEEALKWLTLSAQKGNMFAAYRAAKLLETGTEATPPNRARAQIFYNIALNGFLAADAVRPDGNMRFTIGRMFLQGDGTAVDRAAALHWFMLSAEQGNADAQFQAARILQQAQSSEGSRRRAQVYYATALQEYLRKVRSVYNPFLKYRIGTMYEFGLGAERNVDTAKEWYRQAAQEGNEDAVNRLRQIDQFEKKQAAGAVMRLFRFFARALGHNVQDSTTHKYCADRKLRQKQRMLHNQSRNQEQGM